MEQKSKSEQLFGELRRRITNLPDNAPFPSIRNLMKEYNVSQLTVTTALDNLKSLGMLTANPRSGLIVNKPQVSVPRVLIIQPDWTRKAQFFKETELLMDAIKQAGFFPLVHFYDYQQNIIDHLETLDAELLLLCSTPIHYFTPARLVKIANSPIPVIVLNDLLLVEGINSVCRSSGDSGVIAATCFYQNGHRQLYSLYSEPKSSHMSHTHHLFKTTVLALGGTVKEWNCDINYEDYPDDKLKIFAKEFAKGMHPCTGIFTSSSTSAVILIEELAKLGIKVPNDVSVIGLGDNAIAEKYGLTVLATVTKETAAETMRIAGILLNGPFEETFLQTECSPELIKRNSVKTIINIEKEKQYKGA